MMLGVPGVGVQDRANPSQDPRLTIRGFGARSAFGVRGVRVMRDGVPLSLPDGQTPIDWLELESVGSIEVIRGTAAALLRQCGRWCGGLSLAFTDGGAAWCRCAVVEWRRTDAHYGDRQRQVRSHAMHRSLGMADYMMSARCLR
jgi:iron complex outermembrane receptor protein